MSLETVSTNKSHGGVQGVYKHSSKETGTDMTFSVFVPPARGGREAAGRLVSLRPHLHPCQRHRKGRIPAPLRRARPDLRGARHLAARRRRAGRCRGRLRFRPRRRLLCRCDRGALRQELPHVVLCHRGTAGARRGGISRRHEPPVDHGPFHGRPRRADHRPDLPGSLQGGVGLFADRRAGPGAVGREGPARLSRRRQDGVEEARRGRADRGRREASTRCWSTRARPTTSSKAS